MDEFEVVADRRNDVLDGEAACGVEVLGESGAVGVGESEDGGEITASVDEQRAVPGACGHDGEGGGDDGDVLSASGGVDGGDRHGESPFRIEEPVLSGCGAGLVCRSSREPAGAPAARPSPRPDPTAHNVSGGLVADIRSPFHGKAIDGHSRARIKLPPVQLRPTRGSGEPHVPEPGGPAWRRIQCWHPCALGILRQAERVGFEVVQPWATGVHFGARGTANSSPCSQAPANSHNRAQALGRAIGRCPHIDEEGP